MTSKQIKQILLEKGVTHLYHSNTVTTASTFIQRGGLLSRGAVEDLNCYQTPQYTDELDKTVDVYYDIFFDSVDIHNRSRNVNYYGPVLFIYSIGLLDTLPPDCVKITKDNPARWSPGMEESERYFLTPEELRNGYFCGNFSQHLTIRHRKEPLAFDYLESIVIDDPGLKDSSHFNNACVHLENLIETQINMISLEIRKCKPYCECENYYRSRSIDQIEKLYGIDWM